MTAQLSEALDEGNFSELGERPSVAHWDGAFAMSLCVFALVASEFMPVSLLTPIATDLRITEGMAGQGIAISGAFAVLTSLSISALAGAVDRKTLLLPLTVLMGISGAVVAEASSYSIYMAAAHGRQIRARTAPAITYGHSKGHRPDLKQLLFILTMSADGNIPVAFRCTDGNTSDSVTQIETWNTLRSVAGRGDFFYCADTKLCSVENMSHIDRAGGRFVTVMPRSRLEHAQFRDAIQTRTPEWTLVWDRPNPRYSDGPRDCWYVHRAPRTAHRCRRWRPGRSSGSGARY